MSDVVKICDMEVEFDADYVGISGLLWSNDFGWNRGNVWKRASGEIVATATGFHNVKWTHYMPLPAPPTQ